MQLRLRDGVWSVLCDPNQLESALLNLVINARDAMPTGGTLTIATADRSLSLDDLIDQDEAKPGPYVEIAVTDTGTGMTPDVVRARVRAIFYQADRLQDLDSACHRCSASCASPADS